MSYSTFIYFGPYWSCKDKISDKDLDTETKSAIWCKCVNGFDLWFPNVTRDRGARKMSFWVNQEDDFTQCCASKIVEREWLGRVYEKEWEILLGSYRNVIVEWGLVHCKI